MALNSNVKALREIWDLWSVRGCIMFSLSLQIFLFFFSPLRRKTASTVVNFLLWSAYLLADWVPTFTAGLVLKSLSTPATTTTSYSTNSSTGPPGVNDDLLALWAASLLWHLGGSFSITAFALEDNELWFRHSIAMVAQFVTASYVFLRTLPDNKLMVPTIFSLLGGFFSNVLRAKSMHRASLDECRKDVVMEYGSLGFPADPAILLDATNSRHPVHRVNVLAVAFDYFQFFKGLVVNIKCLSFEGQRQEIKEYFCSKISSDVAYQLISCELNFIYQRFYTNRIELAKRFGICCWLIAFVSSTVVLGRFVQADKQDFHRVDIRISTALVIVPLVLCLLTPYFLLYRLLSLSTPSNMEKAGFWRFLAKYFCNYATGYLHFWIQYFCESIRPREFQINIKPVTTHKIDGTPIFFREWSESICSHNFISYCLKERPRCISRPYQPWVAWICKAFQAVRRVLLFPGKLGVIIFRLVLDFLGLKDTLDRAMYVSRDPFDKELWNFIFKSMQNASTNNEVGKLTSEARGGWVPQNICDPSTSRLVLSYIKDVEYDESLLLWHIATELSYNADDDGDLSDKETSNNRVFSKMLSDYMLYLMVFQPSMMSTISGTFLKRYSVSCEQITRFLLKIRLGGEDGRLKETCRSIRDQISRLLHEIYLGGEDGRLKEACRSILDQRAEFPKTDSEKDGAPTVMPRACTLTDELKNLPKGERWRLLSHVWFEMLIYAARNCKGDTHARSLCRGGELLSLVWLLMAHFGFDMGHCLPVRVVGEAVRTPSTLSHV